jgi:hypothetical protein
MRVIEQLVQHFWTRGALTREEAQYLVKHGFVREGDLPGLVEDAERTDVWDVEPDPRFDPKARAAEELEDELTGRNSAGGRRGKKKKPAGHNVAPLATHLGSHLSSREAFPALHELGQRLTPCADWRGAARAVAAAESDDLEAALVAVLNARPRALGELWFWFDLEPVFEWAERGDNAGPVADAIGKLLRADTPGRVGRLDQLLKVPEVQALTDLLAARGAFLAALQGCSCASSTGSGSGSCRPRSGPPGRGRRCRGRSSSSTTPARAPPTCRRPATPWTRTNSRSRC